MDRLLTRLDKIRLFYNQHVCLSTCLPSLLPYTSVISSRLSSLYFLIAPSMFLRISSALRTDGLSKCGFRDLVPAIKSAMLPNMDARRKPMIKGTSKSGITDILTTSAFPDLSALQRTSQSQIKSSSSSSSSD